MDLRTHVSALLEKYGHNDQRTDAWHMKRGEMLTASEIWKTVKDSTPSSRHELIMSKLTPRKDNGGFGGRALAWGTQFEPIAKEIYEKEMEVDLVDTTCVQHPVHTFLGASPDGVILSDKWYGHLVEFKCPISREIDDSKPVPTEYIHQMQLQMECTGLDVCHYAEFKFKAVNYSEWLDADVKYKSAIMVLDDGRTYYKEVDDTRTISEWKNEIFHNITIPIDEEFNEYQIAYWILQKTRFHTLEKDPNWMTTHLPTFEETWTEVLKHREAGTLPENPRAKNTLCL